MVFAEVTLVKANLLSHLFEAYNDKDQIDMIMLDFSKAFDVQNSSSQTEKLWY